MVPCNCFEFGFSLRKEKISSFSLKKKNPVVSPPTVPILVDLPASLGAVTHSLLPGAFCSLGFQDAKHFAPLLLCKPPLSFLCLLSALALLVSSSWLVLLNSIHTPTNQQLPNLFSQPGPGLSPSAYSLTTSAWMSKILNLTCLTLNFWSSSSEITLVSQYLPKLLPSQLMATPFQTWKPKTYPRKGFCFGVPPHHIHIPFPVCHASSTFTIYWEWNSFPPSLLTLVQATTISHLSSCRIFLAGLPAWALACLQSIPSIVTRVIVSKQVVSCHSSLQNSAGTPPFTKNKEEGPYCGHKGAAWFPFLLVVSPTLSPNALLWSSLCCLFRAFQLSLLSLLPQKLSLSYLP